MRVIITVTQVVEIKKGINTIKETLEEQKRFSGDFLMLGSVFDAIGEKFTVIEQHLTIKKI